VRQWCSLFAVELWDIWDGLAVLRFDDDSQHDDSNMPTIKMSTPTMPTVKKLTPNMPTVKMSTLEKRHLADFHVVESYKMSTFLSTVLF
jgi:hypothetical protein